MIDFKDKKVAVIGLGVEGLSNVKYLIRHSASVSVRDVKEEKDIDQEILNQIKNPRVDFVFGPRYLEEIENFDFVFRSPGIRPDLPQIEQAKKKGVEVSSNTKLFFDSCLAKLLVWPEQKGREPPRLLFTRC